MGQSGIKSTTNNHFEAIYEAPWGGVASDNYATDIAPGDFVQCDGFTIRSGKLCSAFITHNITDRGGANQLTIDWTLSAAGAYIVHLGNVNVPSLGFYYKTIYALDQLGNSYLFSVIPGIAGNWGFTLDQTTGVGALNFSCAQIINGAVYIFDFLAGRSYIYTPGLSYVLNNSYVGGKYCTVLDGYLLTANTNQPTDAPPIKRGRVNWSAPYAFGVWDPAIDRRAGYNVLADVQDEITGIFSLANVGFVLRTSGLTQLTPIGIAIQPFDFPTLATGNFGIGCTYPDTVDTFANYAAWGDGDNFYLFSGGAPQAICGKAQEAIYKDLWNPLTVDPNTGFNSNVSGRFINGSGNLKTPALRYVIAITDSASLNSPVYAINVIFWIYDISKKTWTRILFDMKKYLNTTYGATQVNQLFYSGLSSINLTPFTGTGLNYCIYTYSCQLVEAGVTTTNVNAVVNINEIVLGEYVLSEFLNNTGTLVFKQEEVKIRRQPTISLVTIRAAGYGTIQVTVGNASFTSIVLTTDPNNPAPMQTFISSGIFTGEVPQLQLTTSGASLTINKVMMSGTYADGDLG